MKCHANPSQAQRIIKEETDKNIEVVRKTIQAIDAHVLLDKFGFTLEQLAQFFDCIQYQYESVVQGYVTFEDIINNLKKEYDLDLRFNFR